MPGKRQRRPLEKPTKHPVQPVTKDQLPMIRCERCKQVLYFDARRTTAVKTLNRHLREKHGMPGD